jgi:O-antigen/teichoic acid export membrane protein
MWLRSRWFALLVIASALSEYVPLAFVARVSGAGALATFGLATQLAAGPALALMSVMIFLTPEGSDPSVSLSNYRELVKRSVLPALALFALAAIAAPVVIPFVFGREFATAVAPFELLLIATAVFVTANPLQILLLRMRDDRGLALFDIIRIATVVPALFLFTAWFSTPVAAGCAVAASAVISRTSGLVSLARKRDLYSSRPRM